MADEAAAKSDKPTRQRIDLKAEEDYWRAHHDTQPHAREGTTFEHFAPAYRVGAEAVDKYPGRDFDEIEDELALDYQKHEAGSALPWDHVRGASKAAWARVNGLFAREPTRGMRGSI